MWLNIHAVFSCFQSSDTILSHAVVNRIFFFFPYPNLCVLYVNPDMDLQMENSTF